MSFFSSSPKPDLTRLSDLLKAETLAVARVARLARVNRTHAAVIVRLAGLGPREQRP